MRSALLNASGLPQLRRGEATELTLHVECERALELIHVSFASLFAEPAAQASLSVAVPDGWTAAYDAELEAWALRPPGPPYTATFGGVHPSVPDGYAVVPLVADSELRATVGLHVLPAVHPTAPGLFSVLCAQLDPEAVAISRRADEVERTDLRLTLTNRSDAPLAHAPWGPWPPTLTLVIPTGEGGLTTSRRLDDLEVALERGNGWRIVKRRPGPEWDIVAVRDVLAAGETIELSLRGLVTDFAPGTAELQLRAHGFPGFPDDVCAFTVHKRAAPMRVVEPLTLSASGTLSWRVEHASHVQLTGVGEVAPAAEGVPVPPGRAPAVQLTAFDALDGAVVVEQLEIARRPAPPGALPRGAILAWAGGPVPDGFAPCDGTHPDAPDLRGRFIRGAGDGVPAGEPGGGEPHDHGEVRRPISAGLAEAEHRHVPPRGWEDTGLRAGTHHVPVDGAALLEPSPCQRHEHAVEGLDVAIAIAAAPAPRPPWHALAYIMKL
jgi:hypothetical protein